MSNRSIILEKMWLFISIITLFIAIYETYNKQISDTYPFFIISAISAMMYFLRKNTKQNKHQQ